VTAAEKKKYNEQYRARFPEKQRGYDSKRDYSKKRPSARDAQKRKASQALHGAVRRGRIMRPSICSECSIPCTPQGHHEDYSKPLQVIWLCRGCHAARHRKYGASRSSSLP